MIVGSTQAVEPFPRVPPTPPEKAEATFEVQHGFRMELIAAEPLVASPVDLAYDEDGRAYVVEMRDYPFPEEKDARPTEFPGTVRLLEDEDGDGKFDQATIFADQLAWPTSACCYKGGVFVAAAPDIWYFKDTDGDRRADVRRKVFTGFSRYNVQAIMNSLRWGLDNKIYGAAAGNGGAVRHAERPGEPITQLTRRDFRFDPATETIEAISGGQRFGATFDDWGNRFLCNIRNPVQHVVLPLHYLARNPHLVVPSAVHDAAESGDQLRVYRLSPPEPWREFRAQRWALEGANMPRSELIGAGYWTSSSGVFIYRGNEFRELRGNVLIGEVAGNLVHRQILERDGVTFKSRRADDETEFIRSRDNWFRPVNFVNAPHGMLVVLDMYRETIEHPWSIPDDIKTQLDLASGKNRGRIYRLRRGPIGRFYRAPTRLSEWPSSRLVGLLYSKNAWERETAQRLIVERQDKSTINALSGVLDSRETVEHRLHALYTLDALGALTDERLFKILKTRPYPGMYEDPDFELRRHALMLAEKRLPHGSGYSELLDVLASDDQLPVRFQVALSVGYANTTNNIAALIRIARRDSDDPWVRAAILSSPPNIAAAIAPWLVGGSTQAVRPPAGQVILLRDLAAIVGAAGTPAQVTRILEAVNPREEKRWSYALMSGLGQGLARRREKLSDHIARQHRSVKSKLENEMAEVVVLAANRAAVTTNRLPAIELLSFQTFSDVAKVLCECLKPMEPRNVQHASLRALGSFNEPAVAGELLSRWMHLTPPLRDEAVNVLLGRPMWHEPLIAALERGEVSSSQLSVPQRTRLTAIKDEKLANRAKKVLASFVIGPRKDVIDRYQDSLKLVGESSRGQLVYRRECMNCHRLRGEGHDVGPSLETVQHRSPQEILIHVLDPNREVSPNFLEYTVRLADGRVLTGVIANESDSGLTLRRAQNQEDTIVRVEIDDITSSGKSLMPEGVEQKINLQEMADLVAYLKSN